MNKTIRLIVFALLVSVMTLGAAACQRQDENRVAAGADDRAHPDRKTEAISGEDRNFVMDADKSNVQERALGKLAAEKAQSKDVKDFGRMLADDHAEALEDLVDLMDKHEIPQPNTLDDARNSQVAKFQNLSGAAFDREFVSMMVATHEKAVTSFRQESNNGQNEDVRKYAKDMLPTLEQHLEKARSLQHNPSEDRPQTKDQTKPRNK